MHVPGPPFLTGVSPRGGDPTGATCYDPLSTQGPPQPSVHPGAPVGGGCRVTAVLGRKQQGVRFVPTWLARCSWTAPRTCGVDVDRDPGPRHGTATSRVPASLLGQRAG